MNTIVKIATALGCAILIASSAFGQLLFEENFNYTVGDQMLANGWVITGTSVVNPILVTAAGPTYSGYPSSGIGNTTTLTNNGQDINKPFITPVTVGTVYASLLVNVTAAQSGDYFFHLTRTAAPTTDFYGRTFIRLATNSNIAFGIQKGAASATNPIAYTDSIYSLNTTYLLVVKYVFNTVSTTDDQVSLFVFTNPTLPSTEPVTPTVGPITGTQTDVTELGLVALRQGSAATAPSLIVDGIRVGQTWNDAPLPVQFSSFTGTHTNGNAVRLNWTTISEINNYGFFVERRAASGTEFSEVSGSFVSGRGTTNVPQNYSYTDNTVSAGRWFYRLKQVDLDNSVHYTEPIQVDVVTGVNETVAKVFALQQNYPNPFNPETRIRFSVETTGRAVMHVYNLIGQEVATLFDGVAEAGRYYDVKFNGKNLTSGVYFYKLENGKNSALKKLMLVK